ncbi:ankyrin repeat domain-containing protein [Allopusillimonas ginsengisoli]|uniref:ankyrin repeat domain-containing protein n=1 Tax=Allopusillimonas ginsengisoli TaxID=453575 RepID=UPI001FD6BEF6|nr:ankyrin repeat domain-containing protein [Allopusillimonas ginsengisoli]
MYRYPRLIGLLCLFLVSMACRAANPAGWWVDIANDRADKVRVMLQQGADPNEISPDGQPAIMQAIRDGAWKVYEVLLNDRNTVLNAININKETPLMYLAVVGETEKAQALIRRGALVNRLGWTPLQYAASTGQLDTVKMLIANKALVNAPAPDGTTALMMAARAGSEEVVKYLLSVGADATMQNLQKMDAADWARLKHHDKLAQQLDDLTARIMADRESQRKAASGLAAPTGTGHPPSAGPATPQPANTKPAGVPDASDNQAGAPRSSESTDSTSRYFDLDRFNEPAQP